MSVVWSSFDDLGTLIRRHRVDHTVSKVFAALARAQLTLVDDIGSCPSPMTPPRGVYRLVDAAYEKRAGKGVVPLA